MSLMHKNKSVSTHKFAMIPRADIPRSSFQIQSTHKTTFDSGYLIPIYVDEVLPGDMFKLRMTAFARLSTPLYPVMDNLHMDTFFFFVPNRLLWDNWQKFMGEQKNPGDSTEYLVPQVNATPGGYQPNSIFDYMGLPTVGQVQAGKHVPHNALHLRAYNLIWNEWFRDQNLQASLTVPKGDGPDDPAVYELKRRGKRHDYFTSSLPWPQKGEAVQLPLGVSAPVIPTTPGAGPTFNVGGTALVMAGNGGDPNVHFSPAPGLAGPVTWGTPGLVADLADATAASINSMREAFQIQRLLERDARGGTRYTEIIRSHFGVISPDARLQRPEYLGGGSTPVVVSPIAQTSGTSVTGSTTPLGNLAAVGTALASGHGFSQSFTEHGVIIGLLSVRADLTYQQGMRRMWSRRTRYDYYFPVFAHLGEQPVLNQEIYATGDLATDNDIFGYQERWAEYRYMPAMVTGYFRSTTAGTLDAWHLAQKFNTRPQLNAEFIEDRPPVQRVVTVGAQALGKEFILDSFFDVKAVRPMPLYSVPGLIDHF